MLGFGAEGNFDGFRIVLSVQGYLLLSSLYRGAYGNVYVIEFLIICVREYFSIKFYFCLFSD